MTQQITQRQQVQDQLRGIVADYGIATMSGLDAIDQSFRLSDGLVRMREILTDAIVRDVFMKLMDTPLGFMTDRSTKTLSERYDVSVVKDCLIEAMLRGFHPIGNEFNIIAGRFYGAKAGFERIVREFAGVQNFKIEPRVPVLAEGGQLALVPIRATWYIGGTFDAIECVYRKIPGKDGAPDIIEDSRIPVRVNAGMGMDAIAGKAYRKVLARVYQRLTNCSYDVIDGDASEIGTIPTTGTEVRDYGGAAAPAAPTDASGDLAARLQREREKQTTAGAPAAADGPSHAEVKSGGSDAPDRAQGPAVEPSKPPREAGDDTDEIEAERQREAERQKRKR